MVILFMLVSVEAMKQGEGVEIDEPSSPSSRTSQVSLRQSIIQTLQKFGPQKYFTVPPFGCCFRPCVKPHHITAKQLLWVSRLVRQYVVMQVFVNAYFMWARFTLDPYWEVDAVADPPLESVRHGRHVWPFCDVCGDARVAASLEHHQEIHFCQGPGPLHLHQDGI